MNTHCNTRKAGADGRWLRLCITGGIACGKNLVGSALAARGVAILDADLIAHELLRAGRPLFKRVLAAFGRAVLAPNGELDRAALGSLVFASPHALAKLNRITHPAIRKALNERLAAVLRRGTGRKSPRIAGAMVPLVYEAGFNDDWDYILCVAAPVSLQRERLRRRGLSLDQAAARLAAQWPLEEKIRRADFVVFNTGRPECARRQVVRIQDALCS